MEASEVPSNLSTSKLHKWILAHHANEPTLYSLLLSVCLFLIPHPLTQFAHSAPRATAIPSLHVSAPQTGRVLNAQMEKVRSAQSGRCLLLLLLLLLVLGNKGEKRGPSPWHGDANVMLGMLRRARQLFVVTSSSHPRPGISDHKIVSCHHHLHKHVTTKSPCSRQNNVLFTGPKTGPVT